MVLSLEMHCSLPQQETLAAILRSVFGARLHLPPPPGVVADAASESPEALRGKIVVKGKRVTTLLGMGTEPDLDRASITSAIAAKTAPDSEEDDDLHDDELESTQLPADAPPPSGCPRRSPKAVRSSCGGEGEGEGEGGAPAATIDKEEELDAATDAVSVRRGTHDVPPSAQRRGHSHVASSQEERRTVDARLQDQRSRASSCASGSLPSASRTSAETSRPSAQSRGAAAGPGSTCGGLWPRRVESRPRWHTCMADSPRARARASQRPLPRMRGRAGVAQHSLSNSKIASRRAVCHAGRTPAKWATPRATSRRPTPSSRRAQWEGSRRPRKSRRRRRGSMTDRMMAQGVIHRERPELVLLRMCALVEQLTAVCADASDERQAGRSMAERVRAQRAHSDLCSELVRRAAAHEPLWRRRRMVGACGRLGGAPWLGWPPRTADAPAAASKGSRLPSARPAPQTPPKGHVALPPEAACQR